MGGGGRGQLLLTADGDAADGGGGGGGGGGGRAEGAPVAGGRSVLCVCTSPSLLSLLLCWRLPPPPHLPASFRRPLKGGGRTI